MDTATRIGANHRRKGGGLVVLACGALLLGIFAFGAPAFAHDMSSSIYPGGVKAGTGIVYSHSIVEVCDTWADGRGVYIEYMYRGMKGQLGDHNGAAAGCSRTNTYTTVTSFRVCMVVNNWPDYCSEWRGVW